MENSDRGEENSQVDKPHSWKSKMPSQRITTTIDFNLWSSAKALNLGWKTLIEFAVQFKLAEDDRADYPPCKLLDKMITFKDLAELKSKEGINENSNISND